MMVLITYDVDTISETGQKRLRKVARVCQDYGLRVQNSVFECRLSEAQFVILRSKLENIINHELDNIRIYFLGKNWKNRIDSVGKQMVMDIDEELIV